MVGGLIVNSGAVHQHEHGGSHEEDGKSLNDGGKSDAAETVIRDRVVEQTGTQGGVHEWKCGHQPGSSSIVLTAFQIGVAGATARLEAIVASTDDIVGGCGVEARVGGGVRVGWR